MSIHRIEVRPRTGDVDPRGDAAMHSARIAALPTLPTAVSTASVYLLDGDLAEDEVRRIADELLSNPVTEVAVVGVDDHAGLA